MTGFITGLKSVEEVEAGIYEVVVILQRGTTAKLRMNAFTFQAFVTKFIQAPGQERRRAKPIELVKKWFSALCAPSRGCSSFLECGDSGSGSTTCLQREPDGSDHCSRALRQTRIVSMPSRIFKVRPWFGVP